MSYSGQEVCSVHGKMRSVQSLVEDGNGGWMCTMATECKIGGQGPPRSASWDAAALVAAAVASGSGPPSICSVHGKMRSADSLTDDWNGGLCCAPGKECKVSGSTKSTICKFWAEGRCNQGEYCAFAHGDESIAAAPAPYKGGLKGAGKGPKGFDIGAMKGLLKGGKLGPLVAGKGIGKPFGAGPGIVGIGGIKGGLSPVKGKGGGGLILPWMSEKGKGKAPAPAAHSPPSADSLHAGAVICSVHNKPRSINVLEENLDGTYSCKPGFECKEGVGVPGGSGTKRTMCKFFELGTCTKGEKCTYAHSPEELGRPIPGDTYGSYAPVKGKGGGGSARYSPY